MIDDAQRHQDATRDEPPDGASREQWIKARLKSYLRSPLLYRLNSREETVTGRALSREFTDLLDVRTFLALSHLSDMQRKIIVMQYGIWDMTIAEIAARLNCHTMTVYRQRHSALEYLIRIYYDEPEYVLPRRSYVRERDQESAEGCQRGI
jgi:DNA-directed RNA polymerase specialized sigma24 family protein